MADTVSEPGARWLILIHQIPPQPAYVRVKVGRRLARVGAVALKSTVYVLPHNDTAYEDFQWIVREIRAAGGDATVLDARFVDGLSDDEVVELFRSARDVDYLAIAEEARGLALRSSKTMSDSQHRSMTGDVGRLERQLEAIKAIDFFGAPGREPVDGLLAELRKRLVPPATFTASPDVRGAGDYRARRWVTRTGVHVDRIASAWLIRRFIDPEASFVFVPAKGHVPRQGELRFDMFEAEFSHEGDLCTFEVLCARFALEAPGLRAVAELVHDIDVKDGKFGRPEAPGLAAQLAGLCMVQRDDDLRITRGSELFEELLAYFAKQRG